MKKIYCLLLICIFFFLSIGCSDFEEVNTNPNTTPEVTSSMLATKLINELVTTDNENGKGFIFEDLLSKYISWTEAQDIDKAFNLLSRPSYSTLANLRNAVKMIDMATTDQLKNSYTALSHFIRAYVFFNLTIKVGDMPYSEAIEGEEGNYFPKYDTQKDIFLGLLNELDEADRLFAHPTNSIIRERYFSRIID